MFGDTPRKRFRDKIDLPTTQKWYAVRRFHYHNRVRPHVQRRLRQIKGILGWRNPRGISTAKRFYEVVND